MGNTGKTFSHRFNADGTVDSICHGCFLTIATATREADLEDCECSHVCNPEVDLRWSQAEAYPNKRTRRAESLSQSG